MVIELSCHCSSRFPPVNLRERRTGDDSMNAKGKSIKVLLIVPAKIGGLWTAECVVETMHASSCPMLASRRPLSMEGLLSLCVCGMVVGKARITGPLRSMGR